MTALAIIADRHRLVSGYDKGYICVWDLQKKIAIKIIPPTPRPVSFSAGKDGHAVGAKIIHLSFIGSRHDLISGDSDVCSNMAFRFF